MSHVSKFRLVSGAQRAIHFGKGCRDWKKLMNVSVQMTNQLAARLIGSN